MIEGDLIKNKTTPNAENDYNCMIQNSLCNWTSEQEKCENSLLL